MTTASLSSADSWLPTERCGRAPLALALRQSRRVAAHVIDVFGFDEPLIDLGTGSGMVADEVFGQIGTQPTCIEPDRSLAADLVRRSHAVKATVQQLPDGEAKGLYSVHAVSLSAHPHALLEQALAKVQPQGKILIYAPAFPSLHGAEDQRHGHWQRYTRETLTQLLEHAGVRVLRSGYSDAAGFLLKGLLRLGGDRITVTARRARSYDLCLYPLSTWFEPATRALFGANVWCQGVRP